MRKLLYISQLLFKFILIYLISYIWLRYFISTLWVDIVFATAISVAVMTLLHFINKKSSHKRSLKISEREDAENMFLSLIIDGNGSAFFENLIKIRHPNVTNKKDYFIITHPDKTKIALFPFINLQPLSSSDIIRIVNSVQTAGVSKIVIPCYEFDKSALAFTKNFNTEILLLDRFDCYCTLYKEYDFYPEITSKYKKEGRLTFKDLLAYSFNKARTKGYLLASVILLLTSFFVKTTLYYCIIASLLLLFALISYINPRYNLKKGDII